ncbi:MAG: hypothetical protein K1X91_15435 [Bacteriodetes bacterium]|nr:hypothetical protein [Bacteroidota bacterium]
MRTILVLTVLLTTFFVSSYAEADHPGKMCSGPNPGPHYCSCWHTKDEGGVIIPGSGWCSNMAGEIACDHANECPYTNVEPPQGGGGPNEQDQATPQP